MRPIPLRLLPNTVVLKKRTVTTNAVNEEIEAFTGSEEIRASVQDTAPTELNLPDIDGPVILNTTIFTGYRTDVAHLDRLEQTDVDPPRVFRVIYPDDAAGWKHHLEIKCERVLALTTAVVVVPAAPTNLQATPGDQSVGLSWS